MRNGFLELKPLKHRVQCDVRRCGNRCDWGCGTRGETAIADLTYCQEHLEDLWVEMVKKAISKERIAELIRENGLEDLFPVRTIEVIKEVPVEVIKEVTVTKEIVKEIIKEVPVPANKSKKSKGKR